jgi:aminoglycoside 6'-N-acetyltransferase I
MIHCQWICTESVPVLGVMIKRCAVLDQPGWLSLRQALWPDCSREEHVAEMEDFLKSPERHAQFVAYANSDQPVGFAEATVRTDYVNGTTTTPVAFLEALYVLPTARRKGAARRLVEAVASWAIEVGCTELASDAVLENELGQAVHRAIGFIETERVVFFRKSLRLADTERTG